MLDTHVLVWLLIDSPRLGPQARELIRLADPAYYSAASVWEMEIKRKLGKISLPSDYLEHVTRSGLVELPVTARHAAAIGGVSLPHHDPFDRLLLAQTRTEQLSFITSDRILLAQPLTNLVDARE